MGQAGGFAGRDHGPEPQIPVQASSACWGWVGRARPDDVTIHLIHFEASLFVFALAVAHPPLPSPPFVVVVVVAVVDDDRVATAASSFVEETER